MPEKSPQQEQQQTQPQSEATQSESGWLDVPDLTSFTPDVASWMQDAPGGGNASVMGLLPSWMTGGEEASTSDAAGEAAEAVEVAEAAGKASSSPETFTDDGGWTYRPDGPDAFVIVSVPADCADQYGHLVSKRVERGQTGFSSIAEVYGRQAAPEESPEDAAEAVATEAAIDELEAGGDEDGPSTGERARQVLEKLDELDRSYNPTRRLGEALGEQASALWKRWAGDEEQDVEVAAENRKAENRPADEEEALNTVEDGPWVDLVAEAAPEGEGEVYAEYVRSAVLRLRKLGYRNATPEFVGAMLECEVGANWDPDAVNADTGASGLTQFLDSTWLKMAEREGSFLKDHIEEQEEKLGRSLTEDEILDLRFNPEVSMNTGIDYAIFNLKDEEFEAQILEAEGVDDIKELSDDRLFYYGYLGHHEGVVDEDRGKARQYMALKEGQDLDWAREQEEVGSEGAVAETQADQRYLLSETKWSANGPPIAGRRLWDYLEAAGMTLEDLPEDVRARAEAAESDAERKVILNDYGQTLDTRTPEVREKFCKAYTMILDDFAVKKSAKWYEDA